MERKCDANDLCPWLWGGAGQPVDLPLLNRFCNRLLDCSHIYVELLAKIAAYAHERCGPSERRSRERKLDKLVVAMMEPIVEMQRTEREAVRWFFTELRAEWSGEPVRYKDRIDSSAHELAYSFISKALYEWRRLRRLHRDSPIPAWERFYESIMPQLPGAQELWVLMELEYALARKVLLKEQCERQTPNR